MKSETTSRPMGTAWLAVLGGWIAAVGAAALIAPGVAAILATRAPVPNDLGLAAPVLIALAVAYLVGGYVSGRMAGHATSWHGMLTGFFGLLVALVALLVAAASEQGWLSLRPASQSIPGLSAIDLAALGDTIAFGGILGFLVTIFASWLGGVLAPGAIEVVRRPVATVVEDRTVIRERPRQVILPAVGAKGGERVETTDKVPEARAE